MTAFSHEIVAEVVTEFAVEIERQLTRQHGSAFPQREISDAMSLIDAVRATLMDTSVETIAADLATPHAAPENAVERSIKAAMQLAVMLAGETA